MNVIISNEERTNLSNLDIDIIKSITGVYSAKEIVAMFKNFFFNRMIIDVTSLSNYKEINTYEVLSKGLEVDKIIFLLPKGSILCTPKFLSELIHLGIYNFTTNTNGVMHLLKKVNTYEDVERLLKKEDNKEEKTGAVVGTISNPRKQPTSTRRILGIRNITDHAGATTLIYLLLRELELVYGKSSALAIELDKQDFSLFNQTNMISTSKDQIRNIINKHQNINIFLVDLNNSHDESYLTDSIYLIEPSTIKLNRLVRSDRYIFNKIKDKTIILNKSMLINNDVFELESEAGIKIFYNMPPLDERKRNSIIHDFLNRLGFFNNSNKEEDSKIFGLFRR